MSAPQKPVTSSPAYLQRAERIFELKLAGMSNRAIGREIGLSHTTVNNVLNVYLEQKEREVSVLVENYRHVELARVEEVIAANRRILMADDGEDGPDAEDIARASNVILRAVESHAKLLGVEAATANRDPNAQPPAIYDLSEFSDEDLDQELTGMMDPGYMDAAALGFRTALELSDEVRKEFAEVTERAPGGPPRGPRHKKELPVADEADASTVSVTA
jgi:hypothetical protein